MVEISINFEKYTKINREWKEYHHKNIPCKPAKMSCLDRMKCYLFDLLLYNVIVVEYCRLRTFKSHFDNSEKKINRKVRNAAII